MQYPRLVCRRMAEFVGMLLGDGSIGRYKCNSGDAGQREQYVVKFTISQDEESYAEYISDFFKELFDVEPTQYAKSNENALDIRCFKKELFEFITEEVGLRTSPKKDNAIIPERYMGGKLRKDVLRGYFDTDGSLVLADNNGYLYPRLEMKVARSPMQDQFIEIVEDLGFRFGAYELNEGKIRIQMNGKQQLEKWVGEIGFSNQRHLSKLEKV